VLPMHALRTGYRVVRLRSPTGSQLQFGTLLVCLRSEEREGFLGMACTEGHNKLVPDKLNPLRNRSAAPGMGEPRLTMSDKQDVLARERESSSKPRRNSDRSSNMALKEEAEEDEDDEWGPEPEPAPANGDGCDERSSGKRVTHRVTQRVTASGRSSCKASKSEKRSTKRGSICLETLTVDADAAASDLLNTIVLLRTNGQPMGDSHDVNPLRAPLCNHLREVATRLHVPLDEALEFELGNALHRTAAGVGVWFEASVLAQYHSDTYARGGLQLHGEDFFVVPAKDFYVELRAVVSLAPSPSQPLGTLEA